jgi:hypothetical protein
VEIKAIKLGNANLNEFNLNVKVTRATEEAQAGGAAKPAPGAKPAPVAAQPPKQG